MRKVFSLLLLVSLSYNCMANDGGYDLIGDSLHPISIMDASIEYERIIIRRGKSNNYQIDVYMELENHTNRIIRQTIGFEFLQGLLSRTVGVQNFKDFILLVNSVPQAFEYKYVKDNNMHVLLYSPELTPGKNILYHSYILHPGTGSAFGYFNYILETSKRWKGGKIKSLEVFIDLDYSLINFDKNSLSNFEIIGEGKSTNKGYSLGSGYLYKSISDYIPTQDLSFTSTNYYFYNSLDRSPLY